MQIAKSLNYKMRCKGSLKTPPTRIKCIIFSFLQSIRCVLFTQWEKIEKKFRWFRTPKFLSKLNLNCSSQKQKKVWHIFKCFLSTVKLGRAFFLLHACTDWGVVDRVWNSKACFFIICVASLLNNATFVVLPLASFVTHRIIFWVSFESSSLCTFVGHRIVAIDSLLDEQKGFHFLRKMMDALLTPPIQDEPPQRPRGAQKVIARIKTLFRDPPGYF